MVNHGVRKPHEIFLTSLWGATMVLNLVSWLVLISSTKSKFGSTCDFGLYRDDGLGISKASPRQTELIKKDLCSIFSNYGLKITIEANKKTVNFLDVTLNVHDLYQTRKRPRKSNHPLHIIENNAKSINKGLSEIWINEYSFNQAAPLYQKALDDSRYNHRLTFTPNSTVSELHQWKLPLKHHLVQPTFQQECGYKCWAYIPQDPRWRVPGKSCVPQDLQLEHGQDQLQLRAKPQAENRW